jgi:hypothetical protein
LLALGRVNSPQALTPAWRQATRTEIIATIVALGILRKRCAEHQAPWKMIERKDVTWLQRPSIHYDRLIAQVMGRLADYTGIITVARL